jgi:flagellar basal body-associated protein FliL
MPSRAGDAAEPRPGSGLLLVWLIAALVVLLVAVAAMAVVWQRIEAEKHNLQGGASPPAAGERAS